MAPPLLAINPPFEMDSAYATTCDGGGYDSPSYTGTGSQRSVMQRSVSVEYCRLVSSPTELFDSEGSSSSVTKGVDTMQCNRRSESPSSNENLLMENMNKTRRYSPKEKKERIDRYKIKKNQRNFNKKIKYVCRKTLADSRKRIKGRFARYGEIERTNDQGGEEVGFDDEGVNNWIFSFSDPFSSNLIS